jgi:hypothetical protein
MAGNRVPLSNETKELLAMIRSGKLFAIQKSVTWFQAESGGWQSGAEEGLQSAQDALENRGDASGLDSGNYEGGTFPNPSRRCCFGS